MNKFIKIIIVAAILIIVASVAFRLIKSENKTEDPLLLQIHENGLSVLAYTLDGSSDEKIFSYIYPKIEAGEDEWIEVGYQIHLEGGKYHISKNVGETIRQPLGGALKTNPTKVFSVVKANPPVYTDMQGKIRPQAEILEMQTMCVATSDSFDDSGDPEVNKRRIKELTSRRDSVEKVDDANFSDMKIACLESIHSSIERFTAEL